MFVLGCGRLHFDEIQCATTQAPHIAGLEYFLAPNGSDLADGKTAATAWASFDHAWTVLAPGDALTLVDGVYRQAINQPPSGLPGKPITVRAEHDGGAVIDGEDVREACSLNGASEQQRLTDVVLEGVYCRSPIDTTSGGETAVLLYHADRIAVRRVSGYAIHDGVFGVYDSHDVLLEDVAAYGGGDDAFAVGYSTGVVLRRGYARWRTGPNADEALFVVGDSTDTLVENCIAVASPDATASLTAFIEMSDAMPANDNRFLGNVSRGPANGFVIGAGTDIRAAGTHVGDLASIGSGLGFFQRNDAALVAEHLTLVGDGVRFEVSPNVGAALPTELQLTLASSVLSSGSTGLEISSSPLVTRVDHHDNVFDRIATPYGDAAMPGANEPQRAIAWNTATYGDGAYLMRPADAAGAGAEVLYRTIDGVRTTTPLWPWPMEARILAEDGVSVTWESGGGIWRAPPPVSCP